MRRGVGSLALVVLAAGAVAAQTWSLAGGTPADWVAAGRLRSHSPGRLGPRATVAFELAAGPGAEFGLSAGDPALPARRAVQLAVQPAGLAWYDGQRWRAVAAVAGEVRVTVRLDRDRGQYDLDVASQAGSQHVAEVPFWNQVGFPDTLYCATDAPVRRVTLDSFPPLPFTPTLAVDALGGRAVRLAWTPLPAGDGVQIWRNGTSVARFGAGQTVWVDEAVEPRTQYTYRLATSRGGVVTKALVTGPETEITPVNGRWDAVVYGATPGGLAAAVALGRAGRTVALVEPGPAFGGMITGGLSRTDFGSIHALGGLFKEFIDAVARYYVTTYGADSANAKVCRDGLYFEPRVAREVLGAWLAALPTVRFMRLTTLAGVQGTGGRLTAVVVDDQQRVVRRVLRAAAFVDASYEGDLAAAAGAPFRVGRESRAEFGEPHAGRLWWDVWQRRVVQVDGQGDARVQAYNYRLCLTRDIDNRRPPPSPERYERRDYLTLLPDIQRGRLTTLKDILSILELPAHKADANNHPQGNPSSDLIGGADAWPTADGPARERLAQRHRDHLLGLLWFLRFDPEVPEPLLLDAQQWGLPRDEFPETDGWPSQLYVREGRRIVGQALFTELQASAAPGQERPPDQPDSIAVGAYPMDSHATGGRHPDHPDWLEGFFYLARGETKPYPIAYRVLVPQGLTNVWVCGAVSATHIGYGTLRMEPVFMALGTAAGLAADATLAARPGAPLDVPRLQRALLRSGQVLWVFEDTGPGQEGWQGFDLWGTLGAFPSYHARPAEVATAADLDDWLARAAKASPRWWTVARQTAVRQWWAAGGGLTRAQVMAELWRQVDAAP